MKKLMNFTLLLLLTGAICFFLDCSAEKMQLRENIIRLHVVANSDTSEDQSQKLRVRDAVNDYLREVLNGVDSVKMAKNIINDHIHEVKSVAEKQLAKESSAYQVNVTLAEETFDIRHYDTFSLPSGVYTSLRIEIGEAQGKNWWCVAFPSLCMPAAGNKFADVAADAGFSDRLTDSLSRKDQLEVRFFFLDLLGNLENFFYNR